MKRRFIRAELVLAVDGLLRSVRPAGCWRL